jgi:hypothetical protein
MGGAPMSDVEWALAFGDTAGRRVGYDTVGDVIVSTVWLGIDHSFGDAETPVIFETMVFGGPLHEVFDRYATLEGARAGHALMLARVQQAELAMGRAS